MVEFVYSGTRRRAEPYSLRRTKTTGNLLLYAWEEGASNIKTFNVAKMQDVRASAVTFLPRYRVEFG
jgi:predicted DNA-binding transcriptional regulator YafY